MGVRTVELPTAICRCVPSRLDLEIGEKGRAGWFPGGTSVKSVEREITDWPGLELDNSKGRHLKLQGEPRVWPAPPLQCRSAAPRMPLISSPPFHSHSVFRTKRSY